MNEEVLHAPTGSPNQLFEGFAVLCMILEGTEAGHKWRKDDISIRLLRQKPTLDVSTKTPQLDVGKVWRLGVVDCVHQELKTKNPEPQILNPQPSQICRTQPLIRTNLKTPAQNLQSYFLQKVLLSWVCTTRPLNCQDMVSGHGLCTPCRVWG